MDYKENSCEATAWQATLQSLLQNLADKWEAAANTSIIHCQQEPKKLTTEALWVLCVILFFALLCLIGSSVSAYEYLCKVFLKKQTLQSLKEQRNERNEVTQATTGKKDWKGKYRKIFDCFSIPKNARKILSTDTNQGHLNYVDGLRVIAYLWIFIAHFFIFVLLSAKNIDYNLQFLHEMPLMRFGMNGTFAIDIYVVLSGFLTAYSFTNTFEKNNGRISWISFYAVRFLRVTPVYMAILGFYSTLFTYMNSSPVWPTYDTNPVCRKNWIYNLLYINNSIPHKDQCMSMTWFLACIMQLYVISPLFMIPLNRWPRVGYALSAVTICASCYVNFITSKNYNLYATPPKNLNLKELLRQTWILVDEMHQKTYVRLSPYVIGILLGYYLRRRKLSEKNSLLTLTFGWIMFGIEMWFCLFAPQNSEESVCESAVYNGIKGLVFSCGFSWLIFVCATKQGEFVNKLLSHPIFTPISRLLFCAFLVETIVLEAYFLSFDVFAKEIDLSKGMQFNLEWIPNLGYSLLCALGSALVACLLFEYPTIGLIHSYFLEKKKTS